MRVEVYRNITRRTFSIRQAGGKVQKHSNHVLVHDATFVVQPAGRRRVLETRQKNVHAFVRGEWDDIAPASRLKDIDLSIAEQQGLFREVTYNPFKHGYFFYKDTGIACESAKTVWLLEGRVFVPGRATLELLEGINV